MNQFVQVLQLIVALLKNEITESELNDINLQNLSNCFRMMFPVAMEERGDNLEFSFKISDGLNYDFIVHIGINGNGDCFHHIKLEQIN